MRIPAGSEIHLSMEVHQDYHDVRITDAGPGIPTAAQTLIFECFYRVDAARSRPDGASTSGAGLGLAIARWIAEAHGVA